jgi:hypothetical protein
MTHGNALSGILLMSGDIGGLKIPQQTPKIYLQSALLSQNENFKLLPTGSDDKKCQQHT